jgi:hypothetical protein
MLVAVVLFSCMDALIKYASEDYPTGQIIFFRNLFAFVPVFYFLRQAGGLSALRTRRPRDHILRGIVGVTAMGLVFTAFAAAAGRGVALTLSAPIFHRAVGAAAGRKGRASPLVGCDRRLHRRADHDAAGRRPVQSPPCSRSAAGCSTPWR